MSSIIAGNNDLNMTDDEYICVLELCEKYGIKFEFAMWLLCIETSGGQWVNGIAKSSVRGPFQLNTELDMYKDLYKNQSNSLYLRDNYRQYFELAVKHMLTTVTEASEVFSAKTSYLVVGTDKFKYYINKVRVNEVKMSEDMKRWIVWNHGKGSASRLAYYIELVRDKKADYKTEEFCTRQCREHLGWHIAFYELAIERARIIRDIRDKRKIGLI